MTAAPDAQPTAGAPAPPDELYCTWHPDRETGLRCLRCARPMCVECARKHPVGMRCKECARELRPPMYKVSGTGVAVAAVVAWMAGTVFGAIAYMAVFSFGLFGILLGFFLGGLLGGLQAEIVSRAAGRKRGRVIQRVALGGLIAGSLVPLALVGAGVVASLLEGRFGGAAPGGTILIGTLAYLAGGAAAIRSRLA